MQQLFAIIQKEFRIFFNSAIGYVFLAIFLGFSGWLFFRTFFLFGQADLRDFFLFLPWTFLFLIPAFTMRAWAEEARSGTIETLFTSSLSPIKIIFAKGVTLGIFLILALALTLPFTFSVSFLGNLDWGATLVSYLGAFLLGFSYIVIGLLVSALTRNQIVAFLISVLLCFFFYILGESFITIFFPGIISEILHQIGLGAHYKSMIRGVLDTRDLLFYLSFIGLFWVANITVLMREFWPRRHFWQTVTAGSIVVVIFLNIGSQFIFARFDATENKNYTLSEASKNILKEMNTTVSLKAFISANIPAQMQNTARDFKDFLAEYAVWGGHNLELEILDPLNDDEAAELANYFQIPPMQVQVIEKDQQQVLSAYLGLAITLEDPEAENLTERFTKMETLPIITEMSDFEYQLTSAIKKIAAEELPLIGFLSDHGTNKLASLQNRFQQGNPDDLAVRDVLAKNYEVREVTLTTEDLAEITTLIIAGPTENFTAEEVALIQNFLAENKNIIFLADPIQVMGVFTQNSPTDFSNLLADFGLELETALIVDRNSANATFSSGFFTISKPYPFWIKATNLSEKSLITQKLESLMLPWASPIQITEKEDVELEILAKTSPYFAKLPGKEFQEVPIESEEELLEAEEEPGAEIASNMTLAEGEDEMAAAEELTEVATEQVLVDTPISLDPEQNFGISRSKKQPLALAVLAQKAAGKFLLVGNTRFLTRQFAESSQGNLIFLNNAVDALTIGDELIAIRSKKITERPIRLVSDETKAFIRWSNTLLMPILVIAFGLIRHLLRKQKKMLV